MWLLIPIGLLLVFYLLYIQGMLPVKSTRALTFVGSMSGKDRCSASFSACSGTIRRKVRFRKSGTCRFTLDSRLEKGSLQITVLDRAGLPAATLNGSLKSADIVVDAKCRYTLLFTFTAATGSFALSWD